MLPRTARAILGIENDVRSRRTLARTRVAGKTAPPEFVGHREARLASANHENVYRVVIGFARNLRAPAGVPQRKPIAFGWNPGASW